MNGPPRRPAPLPPLLFEPRRAWAVIPVAAALSLLGAIALGALVSLLFPALGGPTFDAKGITFLFAVVVIAPLIETAIMAVALEVLRRLFSPWVTIVLCAAGWAVAHSLAAPAWGLVIWWPFIVFSTVYLVWRERSIALAYAVAAAVHALQNAIPALPMAFA